MCLSWLGVAFCIGRCFIFLSLNFNSKWHRNYVTLYKIIIQFKMFDELEMEITNDKKQTHTGTTPFFVLKQSNVSILIDFVMVKHNKNTTNNSIESIKWWFWKLCANLLVYIMVFFVFIFILQFTQYTFVLNVTMYFRLLVQSSIFASAGTGMRAFTNTQHHKWWVKWSQMKVFSLLVGVCKCLNCLCMSCI